MQQIDIKTLFYLFSIGNLFILIFLSAYILFNKVKAPIINIFIIAKFLLFVLWLLLALRGKIPGFYSIIVANVFLIFAMSYEMYCLAFANKLFTRKHFIRLNSIPILLSILFVVFSAAPENIRVIVASFLIVIIYTLGGGFLVFTKSKTKFQGLTAYFCFGISILYLSRALMVIFSENIIELYTHNILQIVTYIFLFLVSFSWAIVLLLILKEQDEERIEKSNLKLQELIKDKDKFFSIIAHDLRSPLSVLYQLGEILWIKQDEINKVKRDELTEAIYQSSKRTFNLLDNLLKWASSNSGIMKFTPEKINLKKIVDENINILKPNAESKNINLVSLFNGDLWVFADYDMINTVVRNLITNAIKFTHNAGQIDVVLKEVDNENHTIGIVDNGVGINQDTISKILELNSTITTVGTKNEKGSGLGLKLCKEFITKNKGNIWIESQKNEGTKVWISLPRSSAS